MSDLPQFVNHSTVTLVDSMGDDLRVVDAARVSLGKRSSLDENGALREKDCRFIAYLARHQHWTPFAHVIVTLRISTPVFVARQYLKHIVGAVKNDVVENEVSRRYVDDEPNCYLPDVIRSRPAKGIKQGSSGPHSNSDHWRGHIGWLFDQAIEIYNAMIADGVAPEQARIVLPMAHMTEFYETASLAFYARVMKLRLDAHAQQEIRDLAQLIADAIAHVAPISWATLMSNG